jgi:copper chaperone
MEKLLFKTSLKCAGCVKAITLGLESIQEISRWNVDLESENKTLEIETNADVSEKVIESVKKAGYQISRL